MSCGVTDSITNNCNDLRRVGGVNKTAYIFNIADVDSYTIDSSGYVTNINFNAYAGLYKIVSRKQAHSGGYTAVNQDPGGNKFFQHDVIIKCITGNPSDDEVIEELLVAEVGVILQDNNEQYFLYGTDNGLEQTAAVQNTGQATGSDITDTITLTGAETDKPKRVLNTDFATTKNLLETYVV